MARVFNQVLLEENGQTVRVLSSAEANAPINRAKPINERTMKLVGMQNKLKEKFKLSTGDLTLYLTMNR